MGAGAGNSRAIRSITSARIRQAKGALFAADPPGLDRMRPVFEGTLPMMWTRWVECALCGPDDSDSYCVLANCGP